MGIGDFTKEKAPVSSRPTDLSASRRSRRQSRSPKSLATAQLLSMNELDAAEAKLQSYEGSHPVKEIDPNRVRTSQFANRHEEHFQSRTFAELREDIVLSGGNTVPIMVRPVKGDPNADFEVIYGHRRLQACRDAGLQVLALIREATDHELYALMVRENNTREDLSAYEEGISYKKALDAGLYQTQQALSEAIGVSQGRISQVIAITKVPASIIALFSSPLVMQYRWASQILDALKDRRVEVMATAKELKSHQLTDKQVLDQLLARIVPEKMEFKRNGKIVATLISDANGVKLSFAKHALTPEKTQALVEKVEALLAESA